MFKLWLYKNNDTEMMNFAAMISYVYEDIQKYTEWKEVGAPAKYSEAEWGSEDTG